MLKFLHLTATLWAASILFIAEVAFSRSLTATYKYPVVSRSDTDKLICYMQTSDGRTLNLYSLCRNLRLQVVISDVSFDGHHMIGHVVNKTDKTVYFARVNYEVLGEDGSVNDRGFTYTEPQTLSPGQAAAFQTLLPRGSNARATSVEWDEKKNE